MIFQCEVRLQRVDSGYTRTDSKRRNHASSEIGIIIFTIQISWVTLLAVYISFENQQTTSFGL